MIFDLDKLSQYVVFVLNMNKRGIMGSEYHKAKFRRCTVKDFENKGVDVNDEFKMEIDRRICPDIDENEEFYKVLNGYNNFYERHSFSLEVRKCTAEYHSNCKSDEEIEAVLKQFYMTMFIVQEKI